MSEVLVTVKAKGAERWKLGHPWIYRSDVVEGQRRLRDHRDGPRLERCGVPVPIDASPCVLSPRYDAGQPTRRL